MMRLIRYLASCGVASRRNCESIIRSGRITVNGKKETDPFKILSKRDSISFEGQTLVPPAERKILVLNKPAGVITTTRDTHARRTVMDIIPNNKRRIFPIGRLDKETTGILLLTDDGNLAYCLTHPKFAIEKTYEAEVDRHLTDSEIQLITSGVDIGSREVGRAIISEQISNREKVKIILKLHHGKKREVRRIFKVIGLYLNCLHRTTFAGINLGDLPIGASRTVTDEESNFLSKIIDSRLYVPKG